jgi:hypothetical protein
MPQEMTSFVLRFVREMSEEEGARWRGLVQHVQSGAEHNFASFVDAVRFMQGYVLESRMRVAEGEELVDGVPPFDQLVKEMGKMWGDLGPQMVDAWAHTVEQMVNQSAALNKYLDRTAADALRAWWRAAGVDQDDFSARLARLGAQLEALTMRIEALESNSASVPEENTE